MIHNMIYGRTITVTDHKPIVAICKKPLHMAPTHVTEAPTLFLEHYIQEGHRYSRSRYAEPGVCSGDRTTAH